MPTKIVDRFHLKLWISYSLNIKWFPQCFFDPILLDSCCLYLQHLGSSLTYPFICHFSNDSEIKAIGILFSTYPVHIFLISALNVFWFQIHFKCTINLQVFTFPLNQKTFIQDKLLAAQWRLFCNAIYRSQRRLQKNPTDVLWVSCIPFFSQNNWYKIFVCKVLPINTQFSHFSPTPSL